MAEFAVVGQRVPLIEGRYKVKGAPRYTYDVQLPGMLYAKVLMSPYPHAKIESINTSQAESLPGVKAVVTYKDAVGLGFYDFDRAILSDTMRHVGDIVAAVAAINKDIAEEALDLIDVEYKQLEFVLDPEEAMKPGAPQVHPEITENNIVTIGPLVAKFGDIEKGFAEADFILEDRFRVQIVSASAAEPRVGVASWDADGKLTVWASTQGIHEVRDICASVFGIPSSQVRGILHYTGGGFGNKTRPVIEAIAALLAKKAGAPVQLAYITREEFIGGRLRHACILKIKLGLKGDGSITAIQSENIVDTGAYTDAGIGVAAVSQGASTTRRMFKCPNVECTAYPVFTNNSVAGAYRGYGNPQGHFHVELIVARAAEYLNMDPVEFRLQNLWTSQEEATAQGVPLVASFGMPDCIREGAEAIGWAAKWKGWDTPVKVDGAIKRGIGVGLMCHGGGGGTYGHGSAIVKVNIDGSIQLICGASDVGAGELTTLAQVCAETLGVSYEDVYVCCTDTDTTPWTLGTYASRIAHGHSIAVKAAAEEARSHIFNIAAIILGVSPEELEAKDRQIYVKTEPDKSVPLVDVLQSSDAIRDPMGSAATVSSMEGAATFAAQFFEVEVNTETGEVKIVKVVAAHDCGTAINPTVVENQIVGGLMQGGLGYALTEDLIVDGASGAMLNPNWLDYKVYTMMDTPNIEVILVQPFEPKAAYGVKGVGEPPLVGTAPGVLMAIRNAIGVNFKEIPVTPDMILKALGKI